VTSPTAGVEVALDYQHQLERLPTPAVMAGMDIDLVRDCIHCGLCLPKCPTFRALHQEADSPRGRMWQIKEASLGMVAFDDPRFQTHIYQCFNCRACETACPSGVQFGAVMEMARARTPPENRRDRLVRAILLNGLLPHRRRLRAAGMVYRAIEAAGVPAILRRTGSWRAIPLGSFAAFGPPADRQVREETLPALIPAEGERRGRVGLLTGCIQEQMFHGTNRRTALALARNGFDVTVPPDQVCCGALASHAGEAKTAAKLAAHTLATFERSPVEAVVVNAAGCGSNMKEYDVQLRDDPSARAAGAAFSKGVRDATEFLHAAGLRPLRRGMRLRVTYHDPCHLIHGQRISKAPREILRAIPGVELVELPDADWCCGSAGVYNLTHPEIADQALQWKVERILQTGAQVVATANPGCILQIAVGLRRAGHDIPVVHVLDLLGWAYGDTGRPPAVIRRALA
jgi:glycolate oxidase iron-sulfur subunit